MKPKEIKGEVVAQKYGALCVRDYVFFVFGLCCSLLGAFETNLVLHYRVPIVIVGALFILYSVYALIAFYRTPSYIIIYEDGVLRLPHGKTCTPDEVGGCRIVSARGQAGTIATYGKIVLTVRGEEIVLRDVADVRDAQKRLSEICNQGKTTDEKSAK